MCVHRIDRPKSSLLANPTFPALAASPYPVEMSRLHFWHCRKRMKICYDDLILIGLWKGRTSHEVKSSKSSPTCIVWERGGIHLLRVYVKKAVCFTQIPFPLPLFLSFLRSSFLSESGTVPALCIYIWFAWVKPFSSKGFAPYHSKTYFPSWLGAR